MTQIKVEAQQLMVLEGTELVYVSAGKMLNTMALVLWTDHISSIGQFNALLAEFNLSLYRSFLFYKQV